MVAKLVIDLPFQKHPDLPNCSSCGIESARLVPLCLPKRPPPGSAFCEVCAAYDGNPPASVIDDALSVGFIAPSDVIAAKASSQGSKKLRAHSTTIASRSRASTTHKTAMRGSRAFGADHPPRGLFMDVMTLALWSARLADVFFEPEFECKSARVEGKHFGRIWSWIPAVP